MSTKINAKLCRIALFMIWLIVLMPVYTANALVITFDPGTDMVVTDNLAIINFSTDEEVTAKVFYGLEEATEYIDSKPAKTEHSVEISGIASSTTFKFYIEAKNETDTVRSPAEGGDFYGFTTEELRDRTPPRAVTGVAAPAITKTTITLEWKADPRDTDVDHFKIYKGGTLLADSVMELTFTDSDLNSSVEYIYMVSAVDAAGNEGPRTTQKATTRSAAFQPLAITEFKATVFGTSIYATWYTTMPSHTRLRYGQTPLLLDQKKESPEMITSHNISLTGLPPNSNITILAESCDAASNCGNASPVTLRTTQKIDLNLQVDGMDCDANTPKFANSNRLDVNGRASLGAEVTAYVNGNKLRYKSITDTGTFSFSGLELDPNKAENELRMTASDHISADKVCVEKILLDYYAPQVDFTNDTLNISVVTEQSVIIKGNLTDEHKVTMYAYLQSLDDTVPPPAPQDVTNGTVGANSITITWSKYGEDVKDAYKYLIYRTDVADGPIAELEPTATEYTDSNVSTTATYTYQVSAFDRAGNEGPKSDPFSITTLSGGTTAPPVSKIVPSNPSMLMTKEFQLSNNTILFTETLGPLFEGKNVLKVQFTDEAGNVFEKEFQLMSDKEPPKILTPDAGMISELYSPSYMSEILIAGQINKQAGQVWVWVNNNTAEPNYKFDVGENGTFEAEVALSTSVGAAIAGSFTGTASPSRTQGSADVSVSTVTGAGKSNKITMIAVDQYGRRSAPVEGTIEYTPCGENYYWDVTLTEGGNVINSRELLEGIAAYGFGYELKWIGGGNAALARPQNVQVMKATVGATEAKKYDFDWLNGDPLVRTNRGNMTKGFVMINFATQNPPGETYYARESNLSAHRKGECWPYAGCIRLLLQLQIDSEQAPFLPQQSQNTQNTPNTGTGLTGFQAYGGDSWGGQQNTGGWGGQQGTGGSGYNTGQYGSGNTYDAGAFGGYDYSGTAGAQRIGTQKQCIELKIMIDKRIDPSLIPRGLLEASLVAINATLAFLNLIEVPLKYVTQVTIGLCLLSFLSKFVIDALKTYYCKMSGALSALSSGDLAGVANAVKEVAQGSIEKIAGMDDGTDKGACSKEFPTGGTDSNEKNKAANEACKSCAGWISKQKWMTDKWHLFCDRITCPSVPSFQHYIFSNWKNGVRSWSMPSGGEPAEPTTQCPPLGWGRTFTLSASCICGEHNTCSVGQVCLASGECQKVDTPVCILNTVSQTELCKCGDGQVCLQGMNCNADEGANERSYTCVGDEDRTAAGTQQCKAAHPGWDCACPKDRWTETVCTEANQCQQGLCIAPSADFQCCSSTAQEQGPPRGAGTGRAGEGAGTTPTQAGLSPAPSANHDCKDSICCCGYGGAICRQNDCFACGTDQTGCRLGFKCGTTEDITAIIGRTDLMRICVRQQPSGGDCTQYAPAPPTSCRCSNAERCAPGEICRGDVCLDLCPEPGTLTDKDCSCGYAICPAGKTCSRDKKCLSLCPPPGSPAPAEGCVCGINKMTCPSLTTCRDNACEPITCTPNSEVTRNKCACGPQNNPCDVGQFCNSNGECGLSTCTLNSEVTRNKCACGPQNNPCDVGEFCDSNSWCGQKCNVGGSPLGVECSCSNTVHCDPNVRCNTDGTCGAPHIPDRDAPDAGTRGGADAGAVFNLHSESVPTPSSSSRSTLSLITGFDTAGSPSTTATAPAAPSPPEGSQIGSPQPPDYDTVVEYEEGNYKRPDIKNAESDCAFADMGRGPVKEMYTFYDKGVDEEKKKCESGHIPQAACCPFEYMYEWGWGMMFSNELKMSYCLANPDDEEVCGIGETIQRGITGICQPESAHPRATFVVLDDIEYNEGTYGQNMYTTDVGYIVDIDETGTIQTLRRGYFSEAIIHQTQQDSLSQDSIIEIAPGYGLVPAPDSEDIHESFPPRDNADLSRDSQSATQVTSAKSKLMEDIDKVKIRLVRKSQHGTSATPNLLAPVSSEPADEHWFRQIYGLIGEPGRQYLAEPAGSFIQSVLTLCLSGIMSWIQSLKIILTRLQQCLQSILLTGDGEAGMCQALVSQYICDLINEAITCIMHRFGGGGNARVGMGGISGVFGSISDASRGIMSEAQQRYGENNLFSTNFGAENIVADACMFMFTGEIPTNWDTMLDVATYMPINTSAWIFPATRRFQVYNPENGYARYVYKIAYFITAGADIHFDINLGCSAEKFCKDASGNTEKCDCSYPPLTQYGSLGRQLLLPLPTMHMSGDCPENGDLKQFQSCSDEIMFVAEDNPLRYDKAIITWRPAMTMGQTQYGMMNQGIQGSLASPSSVSGGVDADIDEIGSPPLGLCSFNTAQLAFTCGVEIPPTGYARFVSIDLARPAGEPFGIGDSRIANVRIEQALPQDAPSCTGQCDLTKYLTFEVWNGESPSSSARIYPPYGKNIVGERLNENGLHNIAAFDEFSFPQTFTENGEGFVIKPEYFGMQARGQSGWKMGSTGSTTSLSQRMGLFVDTNNIQAIGEDISEGSALNISFDGNRFTYAEVSRNEQLRNAFVPAGSPSDCEEQPDSYALTEGINLQITCGNVQFVLKTSDILTKIRVKNEPLARRGEPLLDLKVPQGYFVLEYSTPTQQRASVTCTNQPVTWTMVLSIRDSISLGNGAGYMMSKAPVTDPQTNRQQLAAIPFQVVCRESALSRTPQSGSIKDLVAITAQVRADNTEDNSIYGLWTESDSLGPTQTISVGDFEWVTPGPPTQPQDGFRLSIDSTSPYAILNINVGKINLIPGPGVTVQKNDEPLRKCGTPPCVAELGDTRSRVIKLMITAGDPVFTFTGFREAGGMEGIGAEGLVLTYAEPSVLDGAVKLHKPVPETIFELARVTDYVLNDDGFSVAFSVEPTALLDPLTIGFDVTKMGFAPGGAITVEGTVAGSTETMQKCANAPAAGAGGAGGASCPLDRNGKTATRLWPDPSGATLYVHQLESRIQSACSAGIWMTESGQVLDGGNGYGAIQIGSSYYVTYQGVGQTETPKCGSAAQATQAAKAGKLCTNAPPQVYGSAVTDINSESSSLPTPTESKQGVPLVTGLVPVNPLNNIPSVGSCPLHTETTGMTAYPTEGTKIYPYDCIGRLEGRYVWADEAGNIIKDIVYKDDNDHKYYRTDSRGVTISGRYNTKEEAVAAVTGGAPPAAGTAPTGGGAAPSGGGATTTGSRTAGGQVAGAGTPLTGTVSAGKPCYVVYGDVVGVKTLGVGGSITVKGLTRIEETEVSSINDIRGLVVLIPSNPEQDGLSAFGLSGSGRVIIKGVTTPVGTTIPIEIEVDQAPGVRLDINLFNAKLKTTGDTTVDYIGIGPLPDCAQGDITEPCILAKEESSIILYLPEQPSTALRISGLEASNEACAGKTLGEECSAGTCQSPPFMPQSPLECMSDCRFNYARRNADAILSGTKELPAESHFCIDTSSTYCRDETGTTNIDAASLSPEGCKSDKKCCYTGMTKAKPRGGPGGRRGPNSVQLFGTTFYRENCQEGESSQTTDTKCWHYGAPEACRVMTSIFAGAAELFGSRPVDTASASQNCVNVRFRISEDGMFGKTKRQIIEMLNNERDGLSANDAIRAAQGGQKCGNAQQQLQGYVCVPDRLTGYCQGTPLPKSANNNNGCTSSQTCCNSAGSDVGSGGSCKPTELAYCAQNCPTGMETTAVTGSECDSSTYPPFVCCKRSTPGQACGDGGTCMPQQACNNIHGAVIPSTTTCFNAEGTSGNICCKPEPTDCAVNGKRGACKAETDCRGEKMSPSSCMNQKVCCWDYVQCAGTGNADMEYSDARVKGKLLRGISATGTGPTTCPSGTYCIPGVTNSAQSCHPADMNDQQFADYACEHFTAAGCCEAAKCEGFTINSECYGSSTCEQSQQLYGLQYCKRLASYVLCRGSPLTSGIPRQQSYGRYTPTYPCGDNEVIAMGQRECMTIDSTAFWADACQKITNDLQNTFCRQSSTDKQTMADKCNKLTEWWVNNPCTGAATSASGGGGSETTHSCPEGFYYSISSRECKLAGTHV